MTPPTKSRRREMTANWNWRQQVDHIHRTVVKRWAAYSDEDTRFLMLALSGEVGELANLIKKEWRGDFGLSGLEVWKKNVREELADIRIYLELLSRSLCVDLDGACESKLPELYRRWPEARLHPSPERKVPCLTRRR